MADEFIEMQSLFRREEHFPNNGLLQDLPSRTQRRSAEGVMRYATTKRQKHTPALRRRSSNKTTIGLGSRVVQPTMRQQSGDEDEMTVEDLRAIDFKAIPLPMSLRRQCKASIEQTPTRVSRWESLSSSVARGWNRFRAGIKEWLYSLELWRGHLKEIEGQFGSGVLSYFVFLRWLMFLNLLIFLMEFGFVSLPTLVICYDTSSGDTPDANRSSSNFAAGCKYQLLNGTANSSTTDAAKFILDFLTGQGWISGTIMFYSSYPSDAIISQEGIKYHLPLAYLITGGAYFVVCLVLIIRNLGSGFKEGYIESEGVFNSFCNKVFASWDYCIENKNSSLHKKQLIAEDIKFELDEEERLKRVENRTKKEKYKLYAQRIVINVLIVPALWYVSFIVVIGIIFKRNVTEGGRNTFEQMFIRSALSLSITLPNLILPPLFEILAMFEDWSPRFELALNLWRRVFVKLPSVAVLVILLYQDLESKIEQKGMPSHCEQCWENELAAQMYMLVWVDFAVVLLITLGLESLRKVLFKHTRCFRKIGLTQFDLPRNVLDLAYGQCLILIGAFFSPMLPIMGVLKLIVFFYAKKFSLMRNNKLPEKSYQGARLSSIFTLLLLLTLFMCSSLIGWGISRVPASYCGPFRNVNCDSEKKIFDKLSVVVSTWPAWLHEMVYFLSTAAFFLPALILLLSLLHYYRSMAHAHRHVIGMLKDHLLFEGHYKKDLLGQLNQIQQGINYEEDDIMLNSLEISSALYTA